MQTKITVQRDKNWSEQSKTVFFRDSSLDVIKALQNVLETTNFTSGEIGLQLYIFTQWIEVFQFYQ